jgi:hypothetical protein
VFSCCCKLIDEVPELSEVQVHVFMDIGKTEWRTGLSFWARWRLGATKDEAEGSEEVCEETTVVVRSEAIGKARHTIHLCHF